MQNLESVNGDEPVDLGDVADRTRGPGGDQDDLMGNLRPTAGIADD